MELQGKNRQEIGLLGRKLGMTQVIDSEGAMLPVTVLEMGPCPITQIKTEELDGYNAIQIGFGEKKDKKTNKSEAGHFTKAKVKPQKILREFRQSSDSVSGFELGQEIKADIFQNGDFVDVVGTSAGKGFQGVMKRYNMRGGKKSHGVHEVYRHGGSLGCRFPQHVVKGKKMAGHMGDKKVTTMNMKIVEVRPDSNLILIHGPVPGKKNSTVVLRKAIKKKAS